MSDRTSEAADPNAELEALLLSLRRKQGTWVDWGQACQRLQKGGYNPQTIFEATGFEPIHQNQIIVGAQVYQTLQEVPASDQVLSYFEQRGSDCLYEFRILSPIARVEAATLALDKKLDADDARAAAKAVKDFALVRQPPEAFTTNPGDAVAYQCWRVARLESDLQVRSRLIAKGLKFAYSDTARQAIEQLLTDFTVTQELQAAPLPVYRLESETEMPRILPLLGQLPLPAAALEEVAFGETVGAFGILESQGDRNWVALPGWQVLLKAKQPIALTCQSDGLSAPLPNKAVEEVIVVVDLDQQQWDVNSHFLVAQAGQVTTQWFAAAPEQDLLGRIILVVRPKKILDEDYTKELWQIDE
jgi:hypothetical protein